MAVRIGINGFGRIGRQSLKAIIERAPELEVVAVNDLVDVPMNALLFKHDSTYGAYPGAVSHTDDAIVVDGREIRVLRETDPAALPWQALGVDIVIESTGRFTDADQARAHLGAGARKVIISAPAKKEDATIVLGVNESQYDRKKHNIVSNASCTTNCLAPLAKVIDDNFGIVKGLMTTVHAYTADQRLQDSPHKDLRRARAAGVSMIPTTTGAARAIGLVLPHLKGKLDGFSMRVPTPNVSIVDLVAEVKKPTTKEEVNAALKAAAKGPLKGILAYSEEPLVSIDLCGNPNSSIVDSLLTSVMEGNMVKTLSWYDNEWGYSCRLRDLVLFMFGKLKKRR